MTFPAPDGVLLKMCLETLKLIITAASTLLWKLPNQNLSYKHSIIIFNANKVAD